MADASETVNQFVGLDSILTSVTSSLAKMTAAVGQNLAAVTSLTSATNTASQLMGSMVGSLTSVTGAIDALAAPTKLFVDALDPALITQFSRVMGDLTATLGVAFQPLFEVLIPLVQQIGGILLPVMQDLAPVVQQIAEVFGEILTPIVKILATVMEALLPVISLIADIFGILAPILDLIAAVFKIISLILRPLTPIFEALGKVIKAVTSAISVFTSWLLRKAEEATNSVPLSSGATKVNQQVSTKNFEQIAHDLVMAAAVATGGGGPKKIEDLDATLREILKAIKDADNRRATEIEERFKLARQQIEAIKDRGHEPTLAERESVLRGVGLQTDPTGRTSAVVLLNQQL